MYLRISTGEQTVEPQRKELLDYCARRGWTEVREFSDTISGAKITRFGLEALMADIRRGRVDVLVCVKLDRLGRSLAHLAQLVGELDTHRTALICTSQGIDTSAGNPAGRLQMHVLMGVAEFERALIRERTVAGLDAAKARGSKLGRRKVELTMERQAVLREWAAAIPRPGYTMLAKTLGVSVGTAFKMAKGAIRGKSEDFLIANRGM
jgi:DNA invertase Pin-like site-specific DNA recombinase